MDPRDLWAPLLAKVEHMLGEYRRPAAHQLFRAFGPRRLLRAQRLLELEREALLKRCAGAAGADNPVARPTQEEAPCDDLVEDYQALAESFRVAAQVAEARGDAALAQWLHRRADIHAAQSRFLQG
jgi:hypothetical protein